MMGLAHSVYRCQRQLLCAAAGLCGCESHGVHMHSLKFYMGWVDGFPRRLRYLHTFSARCAALLNLEI
jgi:hypothetical protein